MKGEYEEICLKKQEKNSSGPRLLPNMSGFSRSLQRIQDPYAYLAINVFDQAFKDIKNYFSGGCTPEETEVAKKTIRWIKRMEGNFRILAGGTDLPLDNFHQMCIWKINDIKKEVMRDKEFKKTLDRAQKVEREILKYVREYIGDAKIMEGYWPDYDINCPAVGNIEVKEDRMAHGTGNYAIEFECGGKPSGIDITTAEIYILVDYEYVNIIPTYFLKELVKKSLITNMGHKKGARGYLISRDRILTSPVVNVVERWFDLWL